MKISLDDVSYQVFIAQISKCGAQVKVLDPQNQEHWVGFDESDVMGLYDEDGELFPAAGDLLAKWAAESIHEDRNKK